MKEVPRKFKGVQKDYPVYTAAEADEKGLEFKYWKDVRGSEEWAQSDDGYVSQVLTVNGPYTNSRGIESFQIVLPYCRMFTTPSATVNFEEFYGKGDYSTSAPVDWATYEARKNRTRRVIRMYASIILTKGRASDEDLHILGRVYRPNEEIPKASFKRLLKNPKIKKMVQEELKQLMLDEEITPATVIKRYDDTFKNATKKGQLGVAKSVLDKFSEYLRMDPGAQPPSQGQLPDGGTDDGDLAGLLGGDEEIEATDVDDAEYLEDDEITAQPIEEVADE